MTTLLIAALMATGPSVPGSPAPHLRPIAHAASHRAVDGYEPGATLRIYDVQQSMREMPELVPGQTPNKDILIDRLDISTAEFAPFADRFYAVISGEILVSGRQLFRLSSDDGGQLFIDGKMIIDNDGIHPATPVTADYSGNGWKRFEIRYFEETGQESVKLEVRRDGDPAFKIVDGSIMRTPTGVTRVVSPGPKTVKTIGAMRPGDGMPLVDVNPAWRVVDIRPADWKPQVGSMAVAPDGSLLVGTFQPNQGGQFLPELKDGKIWRLKNGVPTVVAQDLQEPLGMCFFKGNLYITQRTEVTRLKDTDGDGFYETKETVGKGWGVDNYHHFTFGLQEKDGWLYGTLSTTIGNGPGINGANPIYRGSCFRLDPDRYDPAKPGANIEFLTSGHRTPNGIGLGPEGILLVAENQGAWQPANKYNVIEPGGFYGHYNDVKTPNQFHPNGGLPGVFDHRPFVPPALYIPQNEAGNSPTQPLMIPSGPFKGQLYFGDVKYGGLSRGFLEKVNGKWQGGFVHTSHGFEGGTNRLAWGDNGELYVGMIGASDSWGWTDPKTGKDTRFGLQKLVPTGKTAFEIHRVTLNRDGFTVNFTKPVSPASVTPDRIRARTWNYEPTPEYGGEKKNRQTLTVKSVEVAPDRKSIRLVIPGLRPDRVVHLNINAVSDKKEPVLSTECWYTLNAFPTAVVNRKKMNVLVFSKTTGFRHDSIPAGIQALKDLGTQYNFAPTFTEDSNLFTQEKLKSYDVVVFLNTTGDVLNPAQKSAFEQFIRGGKGFVGVHSASDTEYQWPFYGELVGAYFQGHPAGTYQAEINAELPNHPTLTAVPNPWVHNDEWYDFKANPRPNVTVLATVKESSYNHAGMGADHPIIWCHEKLGGRAWYTGLGHTQESYSEILFRTHLAKGIQWAGKKL
jgi:type 1 glutamine amidotransferase